MTNKEMVEQLENAIGLIKQNGKDWLDDRDIPILEACIKLLTASESADKERFEGNQCKAQAGTGMSLTAKKALVGGNGIRPDFNK